MCAYCDSKDHKSNACPTVTIPQARRKLLSEKKLCFNCTGGSHRASECKSKQTCDFARIKTKCAQRVGTPGDPVAEKTTFGWTIMSPGVDRDSNKMLLTQTCTVDYENLCRLDVLGLEDLSENDQDVVHTEFKEQLRRDPDGWYEKGLPWKGNHPPLPSDKRSSIQRLESLMRKLNHMSNTCAEEYDQIIQDQIQENIVESAPEQPNGREFYIPHKPVIRENADSTKLRIVYDASAKERAEVPSLNDCLHAGPSLQNKLWSVLVRGRFHPVAVTADLQKAFLHVRIKRKTVMRFGVIGSPTAKQRYKPSGSNEPCLGWLPRRSCWEE